ncbi:MAG: HEAT repeat domain-containing protein [Candidatus Rifleibacteriota bacterium]
MNQHSNKLIIEINLAGLRSEDSFTREMAIFQLNNYLNDERVQLELGAALIREDNPELRHQIESLLMLAKADSEKAEEFTAPEEATPEIMWQQNPTMKIAELLGRITRLESDRQIECLTRIIREENSPLRLTGFFETSCELARNDKIIAALAERLEDRNEIFVARLLGFLGKVAPVLVLARIKSLLARPNFFIRAQALKILFKYARPQALRLLDELLQTRRGNIGAINLLFLFPFEDIQNLVLRFIENNALNDEKIKKAIENLVYNNPDQAFFRGLIKLQMLRPNEISGIEHLIEIAAEALIVSKILEGEKKSLVNAVMSEISGFIAEKSGIVEVTETSEPEITAVQLEEKAGNEAKVSDQAAAKLERIFEKSEVSPEDIAIIEAAAADRGHDSLLLKVLRKHRVKKPAVLKWLEEKLQHESDESFPVIMQLLAEFDFSRLQPHLPILCLDKNPRIYLQAIRLCRKFAYRRLMKMVEGWVKVDDEQSWKSAVAALLQMQIEDARMILLQNFHVTERVSFIRFFSPVFLITPDYHSLFEIEKIFDHSQGPRRDALFELIEQLQNSLGVTGCSGAAAMGEIAEAGLKARWDEISSWLEHFSFLADETEIVGKFNQFLAKFKLQMAVIAIVLLLLLNWWYQYEPAARPVSVGGLKNRIDQKIAEIKPGTVKFFTLQDYDPINQYWLASGSDNNRYKLKLIEPHRFSAGYKGNFRISEFRISVSGYPVVNCEEVKP